MQAHTSERLQLGLEPTEAKLEHRLEDFPRFLADFAEFGKPTEVQTRDGLTYFVNEYWTARQRQGHSLHEVSYRACFKPQLPAFFIGQLTEPGDWVHDPFMGRGTSLIQALLMNRRPSGNDVNPLSRLLVRPRLSGIQLDEVSRFIEDLEVEGDPAPESDSELTVFFHPHTLGELERLRSSIIMSAPPDAEQVDPRWDWIRMVAINRLTGHSSGFFSGRSLPPNQAVSVQSQRRINERLGQTPPQRDIKRIMLKKSRSLLRDGAPRPSDSNRILVGEASATDPIPRESVGLVVTSPPFLDVVDYASDNWLRCWFAGVDLSSVNISMHKSVEDWTEMVHRVLREQARILAVGRFIAFEVGEVRNGTVLLERAVKAAAEGLSLEVIGVMVNQQAFTKTSNIWGVKNDVKGTNSNRIVLLRKT